MPMVAKKGYLLSDLVYSQNLHFHVFKLAYFKNWEFLILYIPKLVNDLKTNLRTCPMWHCSKLGLEIYMQFRN